MSSVPNHVLAIIEKLESAGFEAVLVGGCVRDLYMNRRPSDWDVATSATPCQVMAEFRRTFPSGIKHGTVTVLSGRGSVEVTTFRSDGDYSDGRRPDNVSFQTDLVTDLSRRDFTMNAMAMRREGEIVDPFFGARDIDAKTVRCVGDPVMRFREDALRIFRAFRFSSVLGFAIDRETMAAAAICSDRCAALSSERICAELCKILMTSRTGLINRILELGLLNRYLLIPGTPVDYISRVGYLSYDQTIRICAFCHLLLKSGQIESPPAFLRDLKLDRHTISVCSKALLNYSDPPADAPTTWKNLLSRESEPVVRCVAALADLEFGGHAFTGQLNSVIRSGECYSTGTLAVNGRDLLEIGFDNGFEIGLTLRFLLDYVIAHPTDNNRYALLLMAKQRLINPIE